MVQCCQSNRTLLFRLGQAKLLVNVQTPFSVNAPELICNRVFILSHRFTGLTVWSGMITGQCAKPKR